MQCEADVKVKEIDEEENVFIDISSKEEIGRIIGKEGATLKALELLIRAIAGKQFSQSVKIVLDADNYLLKREESLKSNALDVAEKVEKRGIPIELGEMTPRERRIIHMFLEGRKKIHTYSRGEGKERRLVIAPGPAPQND
jgi:spoIIIJ-associated protein